MNYSTRRHPFQLILIIYIAQFCILFRSIVFVASYIRLAAFPSILRKNCYISVSSIILPHTNCVRVPNYGFLNNMYYVFKTILRRQNEKDNNFITDMLYARSRNRILLCGLQYRTGYHKTDRSNSLGVLRTSLSRDRRRLFRRRRNNRRAVKRRRCGQMHDSRAFRSGGHRISRSRSGDIRRSGKGQRLSDHVRSAD